MNRKWLSAAMCLMLAGASMAQAQDRPRPPGGGGGGGGGDQRDGGPPPPPPDGNGGGRPGGPGGPGGRGGPGMGRPDGPGMGRPDGPGGQGGQIGMMRGYLDLVESFSRLTKDASTAGVAAVIQANDMLKPRGQDAIISYFTKILPNVKDPAVQRAIRLELITAYKDAGQQEKAMEQLEALMTGGTGGNADAR
jgi:hypothetical protein